MSRSISIRVHGRVQGVGFRYHTRNKAEELELGGFVSNENDGSVYIEVEGDDTAIDEFIGWCMKGPRWASVESIDVNPIDPRHYTYFSIK